MIFAYTHYSARESIPRIFNDKGNSFLDLGVLNILKRNEDFYGISCINVNRITGERDGEFDKSFVNNKEYYIPLIRNFS